MMHNFLSKLNPLNLISSFTPSGIILKVVEYVAIAGAIWWAYDYIRVKPVRDISVIYETKINKMVDEQVVRDEALNQAGEVISKLTNELQSYRAEAKAKRLESLYKEIDKATGGNSGEDFNVSDFNLYKYSF